MNQSLTILSFGGGQDSTTILYKILFQKGYREKYAPGILYVVMADTKNEHPETYAHLEYIQELCKKHGIPFILIDPANGYHSNSWNGGLIKFYEDGNRVGSKCFPKTCTEQLKIRPIYKWLDEMIHQTFGYGVRKKNGQLGKRAISEFAKKHGNINMILGIAKGEEKRVAKSEGKPKWMRESIINVYPLIEEGLDRQGCIDYMESLGLETPIPSNCILCPFMNLQELLYLYRFHEEWYYKWVALERNKINNNQHAENNMGVWGKKLLPEILAEAQKKHGHMTDAELREYRFSHGHCVKSAY